MPRTLGRLRFRPPKQLRPLTFNRARPYDSASLRRHAVELLKPATALSLSITVNPRWKRQPGKKTQKFALKPHTVRDLVDPTETAKHGQIIYVFSNATTGQVIYSLTELLQNFHLDQLPFLGKHSKPGTLRPDQWKPHCVILFEIPEQGLQAFRKLREFRRLHEISWDLNNPEWIRLTYQARMRKIMDQVANTSADLAEVLTIQTRQSETMLQQAKVQERITLAAMARMYAQAETLGKSESDSTTPKWLEGEIRRLDRKLTKESGRDGADVKSLKSMRRAHGIRLQRVLYAQECMKALEQTQQDPEYQTSRKRYHAQAAPAREAGAREALVKLKSEVLALTNELKALQQQKPNAGNHPPNTTAKFPEQERDLANKQAQLDTLQDAFQAQLHYEAHDHPMTRQFYFTKNPTKSAARPFSPNVEIKWADLRNAEYAAGNWPADVVHGVLDLHHARRDVLFVNQKEYQSSIVEEIRGMREKREEVLREREQRAAQSPNSARHGVPQDPRKIRRLRKAKLAEVLRRAKPQPRSNTQAKGAPKNQSKPKQPVERAVA